MPAVMRASAVVEKAGVPAVAIAATSFIPMGRLIGKSLGIPHVDIAEYPGVILVDSEDIFSAKVRSSVLPGVLGGLLAGERVADQPQSVADDYSPRRIVFRGSLDEVLEHFTAQGWTDGMPIVPPTIPRIDRFLAYTDRDPHEVMGRVAPENRQVTPWNIAVHGVMAGCRPEYFPILLAIGDIICDPVFRIEDAGSTPGWEPLVIVSGPMVTELDFNFGTGAMRVGRQANTSIGRFVRLFMRNVPGIRIPPGETDQGAIATTFNVALAEDAESSRRASWPTFGEDQGFAPEDTVVTLQSVVTISAPIYSGGEVPDQLETIGKLFGNAIGPWFYLALQFGGWHPLLVVGPGIARVFDEAGVTKDDLRQYLFDNVTIELSELVRYAWQVGSTSFDLAELVDSGQAPPIYDPRLGLDRQVPLFLRPEWIGVVVAGHPGRNQSRAYVSNHGQGVRVSRKVEVPRVRRDGEPT
jgi:hypothetical protein